jgi:hypothetical protein
MADRRQGNKAGEREPSVTASQCGGWSEQEAKLQAAQARHSGPF